MCLSLNNQVLDLYTVFFLFKKYNAKSKGPHLNMIQRTLKNWPKKNSKAFFLTEITVQSFWESQTAEICLTSPEATRWIGIHRSPGVNVMLLSGFRTRYASNSSE